jgi:hypothetical protein
VGSRELRVEPAKKLGDRSDHRHALMINRRQDRPANEDLAACVVLAFGVTSARSDDSFPSANGQGAHRGSEFERGLFQAAAWLTSDSD